MAPAPCKGPPSRLQQAPQAGAKASCLLPSPGEQTSGALEELDSYIDFSLESLNQMILELDPTFQLLPPGPGSPWAEPTQSTTSRRKKEEPEALDIKYIEVTSARSRCHDGPQSCSSPSVTPPFGSPRSGGLLLSRDIPWETRSSSESLIFSGSQGRGHQRPSPPAGAPSSLPPSSPSISIPSMRHKASGPPGLGSPLVASPGLEKGVGGPAPQLGGRVSVLSSSLASDVSCVFGSSQSLLHSSISSHQSSSRSLESPASSSSSLHSFGPVSSHTRSSDLQVPSNPTPSMGQPRAPHSPSLAKEHASSCPPSIANSMVDIPIVLINGQPEPGSPPCQRTRGHQDFVRPGVASSSNPCPATRSHSQTLPDAPLTTSPEGPTRDMQPTMKFVMDTSKYWFKPSITREQAIELLRKEEPGAFIVRDSSSYRGSFGLALKVHEAPVPAQNRPGEDGSDLIRHFLIESSAKGVHLKGADEEPYFGSLSAFVCQHSIMALALPCKLVIPQKELGGGDGASDPSADGRASCLKKSAGEWRGRGALQAWLCSPPPPRAPPSPGTHARTHRPTRVSHCSLISSSLTRCHIPPPPVHPGPEAVGGEPGGRGAGRRGAPRLTPHPAHNGHPQTGVAPGGLWGPEGPALGVGSSVEGQAPVLGDAGLLDTQKPRTGQHCQSDSSHSVPGALWTPCPFLPLLPTLSKEPGPPGWRQHQSRDRRKIGAPPPPRWRARAQSRANVRGSQSPLGLAPNFSRPHIPCPPA
uniref:SH2 domain-containing protein n=1 Tax=Sus scrofa TaxID=9823 RepID=A0A4X1UD14_PIG